MFQRCSTYPALPLWQHAWEWLGDGLQHQCLSWVGLIQTKAEPSPDGGKTFLSFSPSISVCTHCWVWVHQAPLKTSPLLPRWDCWTAASALLSGRSFLDSGLSQYEGSLCTPVYTGALQSALHAGDPCLRNKKYILLLLLLSKIGANLYITINLFKD